MIPLTDKSRLILVLCAETGGYLIPDRDGHWRGANGNVLAISEKLIEGRHEVDTLRRRGLLVRMTQKQLRAPVLPDWVSPSLPCFGITPEGSAEVVLIKEAFSLRAGL